MKMKMKKKQKKQNLPNLEQDQVCILVAGRYLMVHKTQLVQKSTRKSDADIGAQASNENTHRTHETYYEESDSDEGETNDNLLTNTNVQDAIARDKQIKDKIAEVSCLIFAWNLKKYKIKVKK